MKMYTLVIGFVIQIKHAIIYLCHPYQNVVNAIIFRQYLYVMFNTRVKYFLERND